MLRQDLSTVIIVFSAIFDKRPPVDIAHVRNNRVPFLYAENIETANELLKDEYNATSNLLFTVGQNNGKPYLLSIRIAFYLPVDRGRLSSLGTVVMTLG